MQSNPEIISQVTAQSRKTHNYDRRQAGRRKEPKKEPRENMPSGKERANGEEKEICFPFFAAQSFIRLTALRLARRSLHQNRLARFRLTRIRRDRFHRGDWGAHPCFASPRVGPTVKVGPIMFLRMSVLRWVRAMNRLTIVRPTMVRRTEVRYARIRRYQQERLFRFPTSKAFGFRGECCKGD